MKLSVIIPCYNEADTIATQLEVLAKQYWSEPWEVIVSDNGSTDDSLAIVEKYLPIRHTRISKAEFVGKALKPKSEYILANEVKVLSSSRIG